MIIYNKKEGTNIEGFVYVINKKRSYNWSKNYYFGSKIYKIGYFIYL